MTTLTKESVLDLLRTGSPEERIAFVQDLPPNSFKTMTLQFISSDLPGMIIVALGSLIQEYSFGRNPEYGAILASAAHERALEICQTVPNHGLMPTTLSLFALSHVKALTLLGRSNEVIEATANYLKLYQGNENLPLLKVLRIEALVNLKMLDDADAELKDESIFRNAVTGIEAERLKSKVDSLRASVTTLPSRKGEAPASPGSQAMLELMKGVMAAGVGSGVTAELKTHFAQLDPSVRLDPNDPAQYKHLLETLTDAELYLTKDGPDSELTVRGKVRNAAAIFVHGTPERSATERSLAELESGLAWARNHSVSDLENDALWGIYICRNRMDQPSEAADTIIELRRNLESIRRGIKDPLKRGGVFSTYRFLFNALCEKLQQSNRPEELLEAIESSKGRAIADRLTEQTGEMVEDSAIYGCVSRLPQLARRGKFHYLTLFEDEQCVYAVLVSKHGTVHAIDPIKVASQELREAARDVNPEKWGRPQPWAPGKVSQDVSLRLVPLVAWIEEFLKQGIVEKGDHICYSADEDLHNIPLQYLRFRDGIVMDWLSMSRVHSAFHLDRVLSAKARRAPAKYVGFVVPLRQDLEKKDGEAFLADLDAPLQWLKDHKRKGSAVRLTEATLERVKQEGLDHKIVHFSTHGWFPEQGNPFRESYLLLAAENGLPDRDRVVREDPAGRLTPSEILDARLNFEGSHVSMMACVSGLAKEGIGGDSLGLDWALIQAGAASLISTHWKVSAASAARFFTLFYQKWVGNSESRGSAFRSTMLELLNGDYSAKSLQRWTAFSLTGDIR